MKLYKKYFEFTQYTELDYKLKNYQLVFFYFYEYPKRHSKAMEMGKSGKWDSPLLYGTVRCLADCLAPPASVYEMPVGLLNNCDNQNTSINVQN